MPEIVLAVGHMEIAFVGAAAAIVGGLFGGLLSGAYQHWREHFSRPKLEIDYQDTAANKVEIISEKIDGIEASGLGGLRFQAARYTSRPKCAPRLPNIVVSALLHEPQTWCTSPS